jgi:23S rRNA (uracil1939-C5)-methyltransferase
MRRKEKSRLPLAPGERATLEIDGLNHAGEGVGHMNGFTVFVPGAAPGDLVAAEVISVKPGYARALPIRLERPSPRRVEPFCGYFGRCGGCRLQHIDYAEQLRLKRQIVAETLRRIGGLEVPVAPVLGMPDPRHYRNKYQAPVAAENGQVRVGLYEPRSHHVVELSQCPIQHPAGDQAVVAARQALQELRIPAYDEQRRRGVVRHVIARTSFATGEVLLALVTNGRELPRAARLVELLRRRVQNLAGIVQNINPRPGNVILGQEEITLWGRPYIVERLGELSFRVSTRSFFQVNPVQAEVLYGLVQRLAGLTGRETAFDLYCGIGTIALNLAGGAAQVIGVESVSAAVEDARANAALNGITNATFLVGRAEEKVPELLRAGRRAGVVVLNPPRKGCAPELLDVVARALPERIIYISCNPATLARDLKILAEAGYPAREVHPVDMFPHTSHVETIARIQRKDF